MSVLSFAKTILRLKSAMENFKVLVNAPDVPQSAIGLLKTQVPTIVIEDFTRETILEKIRGVDGVLWASKVKVDKEMIDAAGPQLKIIGSMSAGLDHVDIEELKKRGIKLTNTSVALASTVADMALLLALAASRRMQEGRLHIENGTWTGGNQWMLGQDIHGTTVGIVGLGPIGLEIVKRLKPLGVEKFIYTGHKEKKEGKDLGAQFVSFDELLRQSDFVIASCPLTPETKGMFNEGAFKKMKSTSVFVNISRGDVVDQPALTRALKEKEIFAAGLDVTTPEPLPADHELLKLPNCVLIPHLGSATVKTRARMAELAAQNILNALEGKPLLTPYF